MTGWLRRRGNHGEILCLVGPKTVCQEPHGEKAKGGGGKSVERGDQGVLAVEEEERRRCLLQDSRNQCSPFNVPVKKL
jgi:hypothetical protein